MTTAQDKVDALLKQLDAIDAEAKKKREAIEDALYDAQQVVWKENAKNAPKTSRFDDMEDDDPFQRSDAQAEEDAKKLDERLKRGNYFFCGNFGVVRFVRKIRGSIRQVVVEVKEYPKKNGVSDFTQKPTKHQVRVNVSSLNLEEVKQAKTRVGSRLILCACGACGLKIRVSAKWLNQGVPTCFNGDCEQFGGVLALEGDNQGADMSELAKFHNARQREEGAFKTSQAERDEEKINLKKYYREQAKKAELLGKVLDKKGSEDDIPF